MSDSKPWTETLVETKVTYHIEYQGRLFLIEHVPARVNLETGERHFSPETIERLHQIVQGDTLAARTRTIETPVYEFASILPHN